MEMMKENSAEWHLVKHAITEAEHFSESVEPRMENGEKAEQQNECSR